MALYTAFTGGAVNLLLPASLAWANPQGAQVVQGQATFQTQGNQLTVTNKPGTAINWQSFSINKGESTYFQQVNSSSTVLNRVVNNNPSEILGNLGSNGKVILINPFGITVGKGAAVDTAGFTASTLNITDADFAAGKLRFQGNSLSGGVQVDGVIRSTNGDVMLFAPNVKVGAEGTLKAENGNVVIGAGQKVEVTGRGLEGIRFEIQSSDSKAVNLGRIEGSAVGIFAGTLRHSGIINAQTATLEGGRVVLRAVKDVEVSAGAKVLAEGAPGKAGGQIEVQSASGNISIGAGARLSADSQANPAVAPAGAAGGAINIVADQGKVSIEPGAFISANGSPAGSVRVFGAQEARVAGVLQALSPQSATRIEGVSLTPATARGGKVEVLGQHVVLDTGAAVDVSGDAGGGTILIGGDFQGKNADVPNALNTEVAPGVTLTADGRAVGNGGKIIVWADNDTHFSGTLSAQGGALGGDGGFAETSGKKHLYFRGRVNLAAPRGRTGTLLLDPEEIVIGALLESGAQDGQVSDGVVNADDSGTTFTISVAAIETASASADIILEASRYIRVNTISLLDNTINLGTNRSITLRTRNASGDPSGTGGIDLTTGLVGSAFGIVASGSGSITLDAGYGSSPQTANITTGYLETAGGNITLRSYSGFTRVNNTVSSNGGAIYATAATDLELYHPLVSSNGDISLTGQNVLMLSGSSRGNVNAGTGVVQITAGDRFGVGYDTTLTASAATMSVNRLNLDTSTGLINTSSVLTIAPLSAPRAIQIGGNDDSPGTILGITAAELARISSPQINIGSVGVTGNLTVTEALNRAGQTVVLATQGTISQTAAITVGYLGAHGNGGVTLNNVGNTVGTFAGRSDSGSLLFINSGNFNLGGVSYLSKTSAGGSDLTLSINSGGGMLTLTHDIETNGGNIWLVAPKVRVDAPLVQVKSNSDGVGTGGTIYFNSGTVSANGSGRKLTVDSSSSNANAANINLGVVGNGGDGDYLNRLTVNSTGVGYSGQVLLEGDVKVTGDGTLANAGTISVTSGSVQWQNASGADRTVDSNAGLGLHGGLIDFQNAGVISMLASSTHGLIIKANGNGGGGTSGGTIKLPTIAGNDSATQHINNLNVQAYEAGGSITGYGGINVKGPITMNTAGALKLTSTLAVAAEGLVDLRGQQVTLSGGVTATNGISLESYSGNLVTQALTDTGGDIDLLTNSVGGAIYTGAINTPGDVTVVSTFSLADLGAITSSGANGVSVSGNTGVGLAGAINAYGPVTLQTANGQVIAKNITSSDNEVRLTGKYNVAAQTINAAGTVYISSSDDAVSANGITSGENMSVNVLGKTGVTLNAGVNAGGDVLVQSTNGSITTAGIAMGKYGTQVFLDAYNNITVSADIETVGDNITVYGGNSGGSGHVNLYGHVRSIGAVGTGSLSNGANGGAIDIRSFGGSISIAVGATIASIGGAGFTGTGDSQASSGGNGGTIYLAAGTDMVIGTNAQIFSKGGAGGDSTAITHTWFQHGGWGGDGGTVTVQAQGALTLPSSATIGSYGGAGGNGSSGVMGPDGLDAMLPSQPSGWGQDGGDSGSGGQGGNGGWVVVRANNLTLQGSIESVGGAGGSGGNGANGGMGGDGATDMVSINFPESGGGFGGNGGAAGNGGNGGLVEVETINASPVFTVNGATIRSAGGAAGTAGSKGFGGAAGNPNGSTLGSASAGFDGSDGGTGYEGSRGSVSIDAAEGLTFNSGSIEAGYVSITGQSGYGPIHFGSGVSITAHGDLDISGGSVSSAAGAMFTSYGYNVDITATDGINLNGSLLANGAEVSMSAASGGLVSGSISDAGSVTLMAGASGGNIVMGSTTSWGDVYANSQNGSVTTANITSDGGSVFLYAKTNVTVGGNIFANYGGDITIEAGQSGGTGHSHINGNLQSIGQDDDGEGIRPSNETGGAISVRSNGGSINIASGMLIGSTGGKGGTGLSGSGRTGSNGGDIDLYADTDIVIGGNVQIYSRGGKGGNAVAQGWLDVLSGGTGGSGGYVELTANTGTLTLPATATIGSYGGMGGNGSNGFAGNPGFDALNPSPGDAGEGGADGGAGGTGGNGGNILLQAKHLVINGIVESVGGVGGVGGNGGNGGMGGSGDFAEGFYNLAPGDGGDGGMGGVGGYGGDGGTVTIYGMNGPGSTFQISGGVIRSVGGAIGAAGLGGAGGFAGVQNGATASANDGAAGLNGDNTWITTGSGGTIDIDAPEVLAFNSGTIEGYEVYITGDIVTGTLAMGSGAVISATDYIEVSNEAINMANGSQMAVTGSGASIDLISESQITLAQLTATGGGGSIFVAAPVIVGAVGYAGTHVSADKAQFGNGFGYLADVGTQALPIKVDLTSTADALRVHGDHNVWVSSAADLSLSAVTVEVPTAQTGTINISSGGTLTQFTGSTGNLDVGDVGIKLTGASGVEVSSDGHVNAAGSGHVEISSSAGHVNVFGEVTSESGNIMLTTSAAGSSVAVYGGAMVNAASGKALVSAPIFSVIDSGVAGTLSSGYTGAGPGVVITTDVLGIFTGIVDAGAGGTAALMPLTATNDIHVLSTVAGTANTLEVTTANIEQFRGGALQLGNASLNGGDVVFKTNVAPVTGPQTFAVYGDDVYQEGSTGYLKLTGGLMAKAKGDVSFNEPGNEIPLVAGETTESGGFFRVSSDTDLTVGTVAGVTGINTASEATIEVSSGANLVIAADVRAGGGTPDSTVYLRGATVTVNGPATVAAGDLGISIMTDDLTLNGTLDAGGGAMTFLALTDGRNVEIGGGSAGKLAIDSTELTHITNYTDFLLDGEGGQMFQDVHFAGTSNLGAANLYINVMGNVTQTGAGVITAGNLSVTAASANLSTATNLFGGSVSADVSNGSNGTFWLKNNGNILIDSGANAISAVDSAGGVSLESVTGNIVSPSNLDIQVAAGSSGVVLSGVGVGSASFPVNINTTGSLWVASTGAASAGDIHVNSTGTLKLESINTDGTAQDVRIGNMLVGASGLELTGAGGFATNDNITLGSSSGITLANTGTMVAAKFLLLAGDNTTDAGVSVVSAASPHLVASDTLKIVSHGDIGSFANAVVFDANAIDISTANADTGGSIYLKSTQDVATSFGSIATPVGSQIVRVTAPNVLIDTNLSGDDDFRLAALAGGTLVIDKAGAGVTLSGSGTFTLSGGSGLLINDDLTVQATASLAGGGGAMSVATGRGVTAQADTTFSDLSITSGASLVVGVGGSATVTGSLSNSGLVNVVSGNVTTFNANDNNGTMFIAAGRTLAIQSGAFNNASSGTISGSGTISVPTLNNLGTLTPGGGSAIGTLTVAGNLDLQSSSVLDFEWANGSPDRINVSGNLALGGTARVKESGTPFIAGGTGFDAIAFTGNLTNSFASVVSLDADITAYTAQPTGGSNAIIQLNATGVTNNWTKDTNAGELWNNTANWSRGHVPNADEDVVINVGNAPTINVSGGTFNALSLTLNETLTTTSGGNLFVGNGDLTAGSDAVVSMTGGQLSGGGDFHFNSGSLLKMQGGAVAGSGTIYLNSGSTANIEPSSTAVLNRNMINDSTINVGYQFNIGAGKTLTNNGFIVLTADASFGIGGAGLLDNASGGTINLANSGSATAQITALLDNSGTINVNNRNLSITGGGSSDGTIIISSGKSLFLQNSFNSSGLIENNAGTLHLNPASSNSVVIGGVYSEPSSDGTINVAGGSTSGDSVFNTSINTANLLQSNGTIKGSGDITAGTFNHTGGHIDGGVGTTLTTTGLVTYSGVNNISNRNWSILGGFDLVGGQLGIAAGTTVTNELGSTLNLNASYLGVLDTITGAGTLANAGTMRQNFTSTNTGESMVIGTAVFDNSGTVEIASATDIRALVINSAGTHTGAFNIGAGQEMRFGGSVTRDFNVGSSISNSGTLSLNGGTNTFSGTFTSPGVLNLGSASLNFSTGGIVSLGTFNMNNGAFSVLAGADPVTVTGAATLNGTLADSAGVFTIANTATASVSTGLDVGARTLRNEGTFNLNSGAILMLDGNNSIFQNAGTFNQNGSSTVQDFFGAHAGVSTLSNESGGVYNFNSTETNGVESVVNNAAGSKLFINSGQFKASSGLTQDGTITIGGGTTLVAGAGLGITNDGLIAGAGAINVGNQVFTNNGTLQPGGAGAVGTLTVNSSNATGFVNSATGVIDIDVASAASYDKIVATGTNANVALGTVNVLELSPVLEVGNNLDVVQYTGASTNFIGTLSAPMDVGMTSTPTANALRLSVTSVTNNWNSDVDGSWSTAGNWTRGTPTASQDVVISRGSADPVVTVSGSAAAARSITVDDELHISSNTLTAGVGGINIGSTGVVEVSGGALHNTAGTGNSGEIKVNGGTFVSDGNVLGSSGSTFTMLSGTVSGAGNVVFFGGSEFYWDGGTFTGAGLLSTTSGSSTYLGASAPRSLDRGWSNSSGATIDWNDTGTGRVVISAGKTFLNQGTINLNGSSGTFTSGSGQLSNDATIIKTGAGSVLIGSGFDHNAGASAQINGGTLRLNGTSTDTGNYTLASGSTLALEGGNRTFSGGTSGVLGTGVLSATGGTQTFAGGSSFAVANAGTVKVNGASLVVDNGATQSVGSNVSVDAGVLSIKSGQLDFNSGSGLSGNGTLSIGAGAHGMFNAGSALTLSGPVNVAGELGVSTGGVVTVGTLATTGNYLLSGASSLNVSSQLNLAGTGTLAGTGGVTLQSGGNASLGGTPTLAGVLSIAGTATIAGSDLVRFNGGTLHVASSGQLNSTSNAVALFDEIGAGSKLRNEGKVNLTLQSGTNPVAEVRVENLTGGTLSTNGTGLTLTMAGGGVNQPGARLNVGSGQTLRFTDDFTLAGEVFASSATVLQDAAGKFLTVTGVDVDYQVTNTKVNAGTLVVNSTGTLGVQLGQLTLADDTRVQGTAANIQAISLTAGNATLATGSGLTVPSVFLNNSGNFTIENSSLTSGGIQVNGAGDIRLDSGSTLHVTGGSLTFNTDADITTNGVGSNLVVNDGLIRKQTATGVSAIQVALANNSGGTLDVLTGTLRVDEFDGMQNLGTIQVASGAVLSTNGMDLSNYGLIQGNGTLDLGGSGVTLFNEAGGTLSAGGSGAAGTLTINGDLDLVGGSIKQELLNTSTYDQIHVSGDAFTAAAVNIDVADLAGATYNPNDTFDIIRSTGGTVGGTLPTFVPSVSFDGSFVTVPFDALRMRAIAQDNYWTGGTGFWGTAGNWSLNHTPFAAEQVYITQGGSNTVTISSGAQYAGGVSLSANNTLHLVGGSLTIDGSKTTSLAGTVTVNSGTTLAQTGGTATIAGGVDVRGLMDLTGGSAYTVQSGGKLRIGDGANNGVLNLSGSSTVDVLSGATLTISGNSTHAAVTGAGGQINNAGLAEYTGSGTASVGANIAFDNSGVLNVAGDMLVVDGSFTQGGSVGISSGKSLKVSGGFTNAGLISGAGTVNVGSNTLANAAGGTLSPGGAGSVATLSIAGNLDLTGGTADFDLQSTTVYDRINVTGNLVKGGTFNITETSAFIGGGDTFDIVGFGGSLSGSTPALNYAIGGVSLGLTAPGAVLQLAPTSVTNAWMDNVSGSWTTAGNWTRGHVPNALEDVLIDPLGTQTVNLGSGTQSVRSLSMPGDDLLAISGGTLSPGQTSSIGAGATLNLSGGALAGAGDLGVAGTFNWSGGTVTGSGALNTTGAVSVSGVSTTLSGRTWNVNGGTVNYNSGDLVVNGTFNLNSGAVMNVLVSGVGDDITGTGTFNTSAGSVLNLNAASGSNSLYPSVANLGGTTNLLSGNLDFDETGSTLNLSGTLNMSNGTAIKGYYTLGGGTATVEIESGAVISVVSGTAKVYANGYNLNVNASAALPAAVQVEQTAGTVTLNQDLAFAGSYLLTGGTITGAGNLNVAGLLDWQGGTITGAGTLGVGAGGQVSMSSVGTMTLGRNLFNAGTIDWDAGNLDISGATLTNMSGGKFDITWLDGFNDGLSGSGTLLNASGGVFTVTSGTAAFDVTLDAKFINQGTVNIDASNLDLHVGATHTGSFNIASGATLRVRDTDTHTFAAASSIGGAGKFVQTIDAPTVNVAGTFNPAELELGVGQFNLNGAGPYSVGSVSISGGQLNANAALTVASLSQSGGTLAGSGNVAVTSHFGWNSGTVTGTGQLNTAGLTELGGTAQLDGRAWNNTGSIAIGAGDVLVLSGGAALNNQSGGTLTVGHSGAAGVSFSGAGGTVSNAGLLQLNSSTIATGNANITNSGVLTGSGKLSVGTGTVFNTGTLSPGGAGSVATLSIAGNADLTGGTAQIDLASTSSYDRITVSGDVVAGGTLALTELTPFIGAGDTFDIGTYGGAVSGSLPTLSHSIGGVVLDASTTAPSGGALRITPTVVTNSWIGTSGLWTTAGDWSRGHAPITNEFAVVSPTGGQTVTLASGASGLAGLTLGSDDTFLVTGGNLVLPTASTLSGTVALAGGTLTGPAAALNLGALDWLSGTMTGSGTLSTGNLLLAGAGSRTLNGGMLSTSGPTTLGGGNLLVAAGTLDVNNSLTVSSGSTLALTGGSLVNGQLTNDGAISIGATAPAVTTLGAVGVQTGTFNVASGKTLSLGSGTSTLAAGANVSGGVWDVSAGNVTVAGTVTRGAGSQTRVSGGTLVVDGALTTPDLAVTSGQLNGSGDLTVSQAFAHSGGTIGTGFNNIDITQQSGNLSVGALGATNVTLTASSGALVDGNGAAVNVTASGAVKLSATSGIDIDLSTPVASVAQTGAGAVTISNSGALDLAGFNLPNAGATLSTGGPITQSAPITVQGPLVLSDGGAGVTLTNVANNLNGTVTLNGTGATQITDTSALTVQGSTDSLELVAQDVTLGSLSVSGPLTITATGNIGQSAAISVTGLTYLDAGNAISLSIASSFGDVAMYNASSGATLNSSGAVALSGNLAGHLELTSAGQVTLSGTLGADTVNVNAAGQLVDFTGNVVNFNQLTFNAASLKVHDADSLSIGGTASGAVEIKGGNLIENSGTLSAGSLLVTAHTAGTTVDLLSTTVSGATTFATSGPGTYTDITYHNAAGGTLGGPILASGAVVLNYSTSGLVLPQINADVIDVVAAGAITQSGALTAGTSSSFSAPGQNITLDNAGNTLPQVQFSGKNVHLDSLGTMGIQGTATGTLDATANGITGGATLNAAQASFTAGSGGVSLPGVNQLGTLSVSSGGTTAVEHKGALLIDSIDSAGTFTLNATGAITSTGALVDVPQLVLSGTSIGTSAQAIQTTAGTADITASTGGAYLNATGPLSLTNLDALGNATVTSAGGLSVSNTAASNGNLLLEGNGVTIEATVVGANVTVDSGSGNLYVGRPGGAAGVYGTNSLLLIGQDITIKGGNVDNAVTEVLGSSVSINAAGNFVIEGGTALDASARVQSSNALSITAGGTFSLIGGTQTGAFAMARGAFGAPTSVVAPVVNITGGIGPGAYAALISDGNIVVDASTSINITAGVNTDADALIGSYFGDVTTNTPSCNGCVALSLPPLGNGTTESGVLGGGSQIPIITGNDQTATTVDAINDALDTIVEENTEDEDKTKNSTTIVVEGQTCTP
jgi:filamentous hemagglutinin family protein